MPPEQAAGHPGTVTSPMVGTAYKAPEPGARPFVDVGETVSARSVISAPDTKAPTTGMRENSPTTKASATVSLNGRAAGTWWAPPFRGDVTALLRPGRFDRRVVVDRPDLTGRLGILEYTAQKSFYWGLNEAPLPWAN